MYPIASIILTFATATKMTRCATQDSSRIKGDASKFIECKYCGVNHHKNICQYAHNGKAPLCGYSMYDSPEKECRDPNCYRRHCNKTFKAMSVYWQQQFIERYENLCKLYVPVTCPYHGSLGGCPKKNCRDNHFEGKKKVRNFDAWIDFCSNKSSIDRDAIIYKMVCMYNSRGCNNPSCKYAHFPLTEAYTKHIIQSIKKNAEICKRSLPENYDYSKAASNAIRNASEAAAEVSEDEVAEDEAAEDEVAEDEAAEDEAAEDEAAADKVATTTVVVNSKGSSKNNVDAEVQTEPYDFSDNTEKDDIRGDNDAAFQALIKFKASFTHMMTGDMLLKFFHYLSAEELIAFSKV